MVNLMITAPHGQNTRGNCYMGHSQLFVVVKACPCPFSVWRLEASPAFSRRFAVAGGRVIEGQGEKFGASYSS